MDVACGALTVGECDAALAGAVLLTLSPSSQPHVPIRRLHMDRWHCPRHAVM
ncbi:hypothetical protein [Streptomyces cinnamoneus]|uniref:hypothetical protein n=1 Tax=Streptomyces cinnamoneus TaxID=53446 RepID=UPI003570E196